MSNDGPASRSPPEPGGRVLIADDDRGAREELASMLRGDGHVVEAHEDGSEVVHRVGRGGIDLVMLDVVMPRLSGLEACRLLKGMSLGTFLPVILMSARNDVAHRVEGLRIGADDYVGKPFVQEELLARVAAMLRIRRLVGHMADERERLLRNAMVDEVTGLANRRHFEARLSEERKRAERHHQPFACVLVDVGGAPRDSVAAMLPDSVVARCAAAIKQSVREGDVIARYGYSTLGALLTHTHFAGTIAASERILRDVAAAMDEGGGLSAVSIGAVLYPSRDARTAESMMSAAESALEDARHAGGGCICVVQQRRYMYTPPPQTPVPARSTAPASVRFERGGGGRTERPPSSKPDYPPSSKPDFTPSSRPDFAPSSRTDWARTERPPASSTGRRTAAEPPASEPEPGPGTRKV